MYKDRSKIYYSCSLLKQKKQIVQGLGYISNKHLKRIDALFTIFLGHLFNDKHLKKINEKLEDPDRPTTIFLKFVLYKKAPK